MTRFDFKRTSLKFADARADQLELLKAWLKKPHVAKYWGDGGLTIPDFILFTSGQSSIFRHYFGYYGLHPIVFLMTSIAEEGGHLEQWREKGGKNLTLDIMIGDENFVGKGYGSIILEEFLQQKCKDVAAILIDPELENERAIRFYKKAGFEPQGVYVPKEGGWADIQHLIMKKILKH
ncbi:MAG: GNAT family N-acetyltransferase [Verrucomicrobia bacterium]|nr:GNAT family N-acetyltransferase [Verrucomicrobiota bacterium]